MRAAPASHPVRLVPVLMAIGFVLAACVTTAAPGWTFERPPGASAGGSGAAGGSSAPSVAGSASVAPSASSATAGPTLTLSATNTAYDQTTRTAPAGQAFHIAFTNNDAGVPHNVQIAAADGSQPFKGSLLTGPGTVTYDIAALPAGSYTFSCVVHPAMTGTLTVQ